MSNDFPSKWHQRQFVKEIFKAIIWLSVGYVLGVLITAVGV